MQQLYVARRTGTVWVDGRRHAIQRGVTVAEEGSDMLARHGKLFEPMRVHYPAAPRGRGRSAPAPVEQATARPGEQRTVKLPEQSEQEHPCDYPGCDATAKSPAGLAAHKRSHTREAESA